MLKVVQSFFTLILAVVVLFSTTTVTINKHYCGKILVKTTVIKHNEGCGMEADSNEQQSNTIEKSHCCSDEQLVIEGLDQLQFEKYGLDLDDQYVQLAASINQSGLAFIQTFTYKPPAFFHYKPPPLIKPIYRLNEVYLI